MVALIQERRVETHHGDVEGRGEAQVHAGTRDGRDAYNGARGVGRGLDVERVAPDGAHLFYVITPILCHYVIK